MDKVNVTIHRKYTFKLLKMLPLEISTFIMTIMTCCEDNNDWQAASVIDSKKILSGGRLEIIIIRDYIHVST